MEVDGTIRFNRRERVVAHLGLGTGGGTMQCWMDGWMGVSECD